INLQPGATYVLTRSGTDDAALNGDLDINGGLILNGNNATIDGGGIDRIFDIGAAGSAVSVNMSNLTIRHGSTASANGNAIVNAGYLTLTHVIVRDNVSSDTAVTVYNVTNSTLTLVNSTVTSNT